MNCQNLSAASVPMAAQLLEWLSEPVNFAENLVTVDGGPVTLDPWQRDYLQDECKFINILKSRRVGGSWAMTLKMFIRSQLLGDYSGTFISMNLEEAVGRIEYAERMYESLPRRFKKKRVTRSKTELVFEDFRGRRAVLRSLASRAPRGKGGDVGISELPHCRDAQKIYEGALHVTSRSQRHMLTIESTPFGKCGIFHDVCKGKFPQFKRYEIPWWHCSVLCNDVERAMREAPMLATQKRVENFGTPSIRAIFDSMPIAAFRQESELAFIESDAAAFSMELLEKNCIADFGTDSESGLRFLSINKIPSLDDWLWLDKNIKGILFAGYDVGRKKDEAVLFILDDFSNRLEARMMVRLADTDFVSQENVILEAMRRGVKMFSIDSTGIGLPLAEKIQTRFGSRVTPVHFTAPIKSRLVSTTRMLLINRKLLLPLKRSVLEQMQSVQQKVTDSGNVIFHAARSAGHHADIAWAVMLACRAAHSGEKPAEKPQYEKLSARETWKLRTTRKNSWRY
ncbi:MAG: hypothetical protein IEMM0002_0923 [bacterium]|nr:MAG: hypothetical protein IEMM0002_0923 [bacterium]